MAGAPGDEQRRSVGRIAAGGSRRCDGQLHVVEQKNLPRA
jgi:hypothetical protein